MFRKTLAVILVLTQIFTSSAMVTFAENVKLDTKIENVENQKEEVSKDDTIILDE